MFGYGYPMGMMFDPTYILVIIGAVFSFWASARVNSSFQKYDQVRAKSGLTAAQAAELILEKIRKVPEEDSRVGRLIQPELIARESVAVRN